MTKWNLEAADSECLLLAFDEGGVSGNISGGMFDRGKGGDTRATGRFRGQKGIIIVF